MLKGEKWFGYEFDGGGVLQLRSTSSSNEIVSQT